MRQCKRQQRRAVGKGVFSNCTQTLAKRQLRNLRAAAKCVVANSFNLVSNNYLCETCAIESPLRSGGNGWNITIHNQRSRIAKKDISAYRIDTPAEGYIGEICSIEKPLCLTRGTWNGTIYLDIPLTAIEGVFADCLNASTKRNATKRRAAVKSVVAHLLNTLIDGGGGEH